MKSTPAPAKATVQASAKPAAAIAKPAAKPATPPKVVPAPKPAAAVAARSTDAKETKSSPIARSAEKPVVKPTATTKPVVDAVAAKPAEKPAAAVVAPAAPMRPAMHQARSPFGVRAPFPPIVRPVDPRVAAGGKPGASPKTGFKTHEYIVYPAHGVGQIIATEEQEVAGYKLELFVISFFKDKLTLKVPLPKVLSGAIRKLSDGPTVQKSLDTLTGRARVKRTMWSRRAQEYEAKINSGDLVAIAEVVRDLYRSEAQPEQSYSERQLYEAALDRMAREVAVVQKLTETESLKLIEQHLEKGPRRGTRAEAAADADGDADGDAAGGEIDAAA
ncbi:CarD family transcriptional regulator [Roseiarcaceae bacterium H3SJ34-1]|uniref:CarD family transcriptional regulator n=1 Tax=Terripilifer ovatus TaxID=3032367 RepID=UPI003AB91F96|nr:CarD family transcriptional regulator [Roseiarcaceae bacterium H3SJ34-1]